MSTRCNVAIKLREEDKGKVLTNKSGDEVYIYDNTEYLLIYIHHDGYLEGVGENLFNNIKTYEQALEFILEGDRTSFKTSYVQTGEYYSDNEPAQIMGEIVRVPNDYLYIWNTNNLVEDHWIVAKYSDDKPEFEDLELALNY